MRSAKDFGITGQQREMIHHIELIKEFSAYSIPPFTGKTFGEAMEYIEKWWKLAHEDVNSPTFGY